MTWNPPPQNKTYGIISKYSVRYCNCKFYCNSSSQWNEESINESKISFTIKNLKKWSCYKVQVRVVTMMNGSWSQTIQIRTDEDGKKP